jgi:hypothetical protein
MAVLGIDLNAQHPVRLTRTSMQRLGDDGITSRSILAARDA